MATPNLPKPRSDDDWRSLRFTAKALFTPATPIDDSTLLAGRSLQIDMLLEAVIEPGRHAVLFGERGVGKTSLANTFYSFFSGRNRQVRRIRIQCDPSDNFNSVWRRAFSEIVIADDSEERISLDQFYSRDIVPDDIRRELQSFSPNELPVILIDEFDKIGDKAALGLTANLLKHLADYNVNVTIILVGVADNVTDLIGEHESIKRCISQIQMPRMKPDELGAILDKRLPQLGMKIEADAKWKIITLARGLPAYVHSLGRHAATTCLAARKLTIESAHVDEAIDMVLDQSDLSCRDEFQKAVYSHQTGNMYAEVLLACALTETQDDGFFAPANVIKPLSDILRRRVEIANFQQHLNKFATSDRANVLQKKGRARGYKYRFSDPMMQPYVIMKGIRDGQIPEEARKILTFPQQPSLPIDL